MSSEGSPGSADTPLIPDQRRELLIKLLRGHSVLSVHQLTELLGVSHMTVRRDIAALERQGRAVSVPGGVRIAGQLHHEPSFIDKSTMDQPAKLAIAARAGELLQDGTTVYLDAGTTCQALVPYIVRRQGMTVVTNDFTTANALMGNPDVEVIHTGGRIEHANRSTVGRLAAQTLTQLALDIAFVSTSSWDLQRGVTTPSSAKVEVKQAAMASASRSVLLTGSAKYGTFGMYRVAALSEFESIVTDEGLSPAARETLRAQGIATFVATATE
ncbi:MULTISPECIES: DeoR/GlpR family DNA-binding transcription regulator [Streptomyces]|uniref:DeoR/GlpR family DNA-binding transcription regulator n=1 Tax=Streptomyces TaxID=1883 RepID=UPI001902F2E1|nr:MULTISPECIES: DeoR/GlpR family DNA-binding transcription regulator [unclassified Streptomyces]MCU4745436.1 DeoR/GlpR family DNA-binding transcription regulator [Streptomyces sp. G-5]QQN79557.1 DeoR/GlpR transcriptional regulator [Streptomyces sp. XC 2026]